MGAMGVMALALSVVGGAIGAGLGVGALSGMWGIPAVVAVATVGVVTVGVVGGGAGGGRGSVAACSAPADSACAPAAAGVPVVIPVVNDWPNDCGDNGAVAAAAAGGMPAAGTDGPPTPTAGALGGRGGETVPGGGGPGIGGTTERWRCQCNIGAPLRGSDKPGTTGPLPSAVAAGAVSAPLSVVGCTWRRLTTPNAAASGGRSRRRRSQVVGGHWA